MPELPEVEFAKRQLERWFRDRELVRTEAVTAARTFRDCDITRFRSLRGPLAQVRRKGKYLLLDFGRSQGLLLHLGMTGKLVKRQSAEEVRWSRARFILDSADVIHFQDMRLFGRIDAAATGELEQQEAWKKLGRDPLVDGLDASTLRQVLSDSRQPLKVALMDQTRVAGLGNIHAAEALFRARLHPQRMASSLSNAEWSALAKGMLKSIEFALKAQPENEDIEYVEEPGAKNPFWIYGRAGTPCRRCKTLVESQVQAGRTTHFCPRCQPLKR